MHDFIEKLIKSEKELKKSTRLLYIDIKNLSLNYNLFTKN